MRRVLPLFCLLTLCLQLACAGVGTRTELHRPEMARSMQLMALWPIRVIAVDERFDDARALADTIAAEEGIAGLLGDLDELADSVLAEEMSGHFTVLKPRQLWEMAPDSCLECFPDTCTSQFDACKAVGADAFLHTRITFQGGSHGENAYVVMRLFDISSRTLIAEVHYNTKWGNSYFTYPRVDRTVPDGIRGAAQGLCKRIAVGY